MAGGKQALHFSHSVSSWVSQILAACMVKIKDKVSGDMFQDQVCMAGLTAPGWVQEELDPLVVALWLADIGYIQLCDHFLHAYVC